MEQVLKELKTINERLDCIELQIEEVKKDRKLQNRSILHLDRKVESIEKKVREIQAKTSNISNRPLLDEALPGSSKDVQQIELIEINEKIQEGR